jgi:hypothetical protein
MADTKGKSEGSVASHENLWTAMTHIRCKWIHSLADEPITLYSELDDLRWELRKVEVFRDGKMGYADDGKSFGGAALSLEPLPPLAEIAIDPQFEPVEITRLEFESIWNKAVAHDF